MDNPRYHINISHYPSRVDGQQLVSIGGMTQSIPSYSVAGFVASMPEVKLSATGSSYEEALDNLLIIVSDTENPGNEPLSGIRTW